MSHVIGIDIGTSGIKVGAMDQEANLTFISKESYSLLYPQNGWIELDVHEVWKKTEKLIEQMIQKVSENGGGVDAISLSTFCNSSVLMDKDGNNLAPAIMYLDARSKEQAESIRNIFGEELLYTVTRNRLEPGMYSVSSLLWSRENQPELYNKATKWGNLSTYILFQLTGQFAMDWSQASFSGVFDIVNYRWSSTLCSKLDINQSFLPKITAPFECIGEYRGIDVIAGAADTACSSLALGLKPGNMFESVGTSNVLTVCTDNPEHLDTRFLNRCFVWENQWLSHGAMSTPGASIKWFYDTFLYEKDETSILNELASQSEEGSNGVFFLPYMQGERSPVWDPDARGVFAGMHLNTTKADMFRAILEGSAFGLRQIYEIIEKNYYLDFEGFQSIGGGSKNQVWAQIKANVLKKEIEIQKISETGVYGSCLIAGKAVGYYEDLQNTSNLIQNSTLFTVKPETETFHKYDELYKKFNKLYPSLKEFFEDISK